jgi:hypothetical protein
MTPREISPPGPSITPGERIPRVGLMVHVSPHMDGLFDGIFDVFRK